MSRTIRDRRHLFDDPPPPEFDRDHHCHVDGCYGQSQKDRWWEPEVRPSDRRRMDQANAEETENRPEEIDGK